jgi:hypothetical protein
MQQLDSFSLGPGESSPEVEISREQLDTCNRLRNPRHMPPYGIPIRKISEVSSFFSSLPNVVFGLFFINFEPAGVVTHRTWH